MQSKRRPLLRLAALLAIALGGSPLAAEPLPAYYPQHLPRQGHIDDIHDQGVVINDQLYRLGDSVRIHTPGSAIAPRSVLHKGQEVAFRADRGARGREILELWVLPPGFTRGDMGE